MKFKNYSLVVTVWYFLQSSKCSLHCVCRIAAGANCLLPERARGYVLVRRPHTLRRRLLVEAKNSSRLKTFPPHLILFILNLLLILFVVDELRSVIAP